MPRGAEANLDRDGEDGLRKLILMRPASSTAMGGIMQLIRLSGKALTGPCHSHFHGGHLPHSLSTALASGAGWSGLLKVH